MSHTNKTQSKYDRLKYIRGIKKVEFTNDKYVVGLDCHPLSMDEGGLIVDVTSNHLYRDESKSIRRRMLKGLAKQHNCVAAVLVRIDSETKAVHVVEEWHQSPA